MKINELNNCFISSQFRNSLIENLKIQSCLLNFRFFDTDFLTTIRL
jgi:hypothetical protein